MHNFEIPDLTFPDMPINVGASPWDLRMFLFEGGAALKKKKVAETLDQGHLGNVILARLPLVLSLHETIAGSIAKGASPRTVENQMMALRDFYRYIDDAKHGDPTHKNATHFFVLWMDWYHKRKMKKEVLESSSYRTGVTAGSVLADAIGVKASTLYRAARLERKSKSNWTQSPTSTAAKLNLEATFNFGYALLDICDAYSVEAIRGTIPLPVRFRNGQYYEDWAGGRPGIGNQKSKRLIDNSNISRSSLINIRMEAELLIFIAQTGMNLTDAWNTKIGDFRYSSHKDGLGVRRYKKRRLGEVEFVIFNEYRPFFERYLDWRKRIFPGGTDEFLFPFINRGFQGRRGKMVFTRLMHRLRLVGVEFIGPQKLRSARINWILRRSNDPAMTAEVHGHSLDVLQRVYEQPNHQVALVQVTNFWKSIDPSITPPGPGRCVEQLPSRIESAPVGSPIPDCQQADGCLFCAHNRDIDSFDHVWALASLRHLKSLEMSRDHFELQSTETRPALSVVERITAKIDWFKQSNKERAEWVREASIRMSEDKHHPRWAGWVEIAECIV